jgi:FlaA1/EpsC-like NDP-sugar epimerase
MTATTRNMLIRLRAPLSALANVVVIGASYLGAFLLRFDFSPSDYFWRLFLITLPATIVVHYASFHVFKMTRGWWRYVGIVDFLNAVKAAIVAGLALSAYIFLFHRHSFFPRSIFLLHLILVIGMSIGLRLAVRLWRQLPQGGERRGERRRLLIIGAGDTGETLLRELRQSARLNYQVVAFLDDDRRKRGAYINGVPVVDASDATPEVVRELKIDEIIVATPSASGEEMRRIIAACRAAQKPFRVMPATWEVLHGRAGLGAAREVDVSDLLRRPPVELDVIGIGRFLTGKRVLVTGAAGSIGSEICRQVLRFQPASLTCLDHDENALFYLERALEEARAGQDVRYKLGDVTDETLLDRLFGALKPQVVFHAAAHKHVPMLEANPVEGMRNNVFGTASVATLAGRHGAEAFVLVSTDKAVNPSSVMGASKRIAELLVRTLPFDTRYAAVRFGNVLGSQGSVVPLLKEQIARGGPVTITHPDMKRYFMTIPEAVELVIQAAAMGRGHEVFMLDMGEPVKIVDLAKDLITLSGLRPGEDIEITFTGIRPGEKLAEELYLEVEKADRTTHPKILVARSAELDLAKLTAQLAELRRAVDAHDEPTVRRLIPELVPEYGQKAIVGNVVPITAARR